MAADRFVDRGYDASVVNNKNTTTDSTGYSPVTYTGTITLPSGERVPVASGATAGPVAVGAQPLAPNPTYVANVQQPAGGMTDAQQSAYDILQASVSSWFGSDPTIYNQAIAFIKNAVLNNMGPETVTAEMRQQDFYKTRFAGNATRVTNGLNALPEGTYVALENDFSKTMTQYGVKNLATKSQFANLIGNDVSNTELGYRLDLAVNQVQNADPTVLSTLKQFYPSIGTSDLVSYFLAPAETLPALQRQVQTADIGAAAINQGLTASQTSAAALAAYGITQDQARTGYAKVAAALPATSKLANIYGETGIKYDQTAAESEFFKDNASVARQRQQLAQLENANFSGRSGLSPNVDALKQSLQGKF